MVDGLTHTRYGLSEMVRSHRTPGGLPLFFLEEIRGGAQCSITKKEISGRSDEKRHQLCQDAPLHEHAGDGRTSADALRNTEPIEAAKPLYAGKFHLRDRQNVTIRHGQLHQFIQSPKIQKILKN